MKIISGGQTGADRAALDWAIDHNIPHGGFCPNGRRSEDGKVPLKYNLVQTESRNYLVRTEKNVRVADATVIFMRDDVPSPGSHMTIRYCESHDKPWIVLGKMHDPEKDAQELSLFLNKHAPQTLNVAGHRESTCPGIHAYVYRVFTVAQHLTSHLRS